MTKSSSFIYRQSHTHAFLNKFWKKAKTCLSHSLLGKVTEIRQAGPATLDNSRAVQYLTNFYKRYKDKITDYLRTGLIAALAKDAKDQLRLSPARMVSISLVSAVAVNVALSLALRRQIGLWGFCVRGLLTLVGISGLFCKANWPTVKDNSVIFRRLQKREDC